MISNLPCEVITIKQGTKKRDFKNNLVIHLKVEWARNALFKVENRRVLSRVCAT